MRIKILSLAVLTLAITAMGASKPKAGAKANIIEGKKIFETNCATCHGKTGQGDGPTAATLDPKPRNFTDAAYMQKRPIEALKKVITEGGAANGFSPFMAAWGGTLTPKQIDDVLAYVLTFSAKKSK